MPVPKGFKEKKLSYPVSRCTLKSIRTKVRDKNHRVIVCCPKGKWDAKRKRCRVGTKGIKLQTRK